MIDSLSTSSFSCTLKGHLFEKTTFSTLEMIIFFLSFRSFFVVEVIMLKFFSYYFKWNMTERLRFSTVVSVYLTIFQTTLNFHVNIDAYTKIHKRVRLFSKFTSDKYWTKMLNFIPYENQRIKPNVSLSKEYMKNHDRLCLEVTHN